MRILLTNTSFSFRSGSELFVYEVGADLVRRGHSAFIYSPRISGELTSPARAAGIEVVDDLAALDQQPDLIHAQHHLESMTALCHFPDAPAVMFCHGMVPWESKPIRHPRILRYVAVSEATRQRIMTECEVDASAVSLLPNFVDMRRFLPRAIPLPATPRRALLFSNYAVRGGYADVVATACAQHGLLLDVVGRGYGNPTETPERILTEYDIVFAHGRAALEALAVGAAVICCDKQGAAPMVTTDNIDWFRIRNFGFGAQTHPITSEYLSEQIGRYDSEDAARVSARVRHTAGLEEAVGRIVEVYDECLAAWASTGAGLRSPNDEGIAVAAYLRFVSTSARRPEAPPAAAPDLQAPLQHLVLDNQRLQVDLDATQQEIGRIQRTLTWRIRQRLLSMGLLRWLFAHVATGFHRRRSPVAGHGSADQERHV